MISLIGTVEHRIDWWKPFLSFFCLSLLLSRLPNFHFVLSPLNHPGKTNLNHPGKTNLNHSGKTNLKQLKRKVFFKNVNKLNQVEKWKSKLTQGQELQDAAPPWDTIQFSDQWFRIRFNCKSSFFLKFVSNWYFIWLLMLTMLNCVKEITLA